MQALARVVARPSTLQLLRPFASSWGPPRALPPARALSAMAPSKTAKRSLRGNAVKKEAAPVSAELPSSSEEPRVAEADTSRSAKFLKLSSGGRRGLETGQSPRKRGTPAPMGAAKAATKRSVRRGPPPAQARPQGKEEYDVVDMEEDLDMDAEELEATVGKDMYDAVVRVFCVHTEPNFSLPWQRKRQQSSTSSGFVISGNRILTNAHSVEYSTQVKVKRRGSDTKYMASVVAVGAECDVALLKVDDPAFFEGIKPITFGGLPRLQDNVAVVGYPVGGDTMSVTSGVVSRIEVTSYVHGNAELLAIQVDAAINAGSSGGPAFNQDGECVGISFQSLKSEDAENVGYVVPVPVIEHFIKDYEVTGSYRGFPCLGLSWQKLENPHLRKSLGMNASQKGVLIRKITKTSPVAAHLEPGDVLMSFDGVDIGNDGTVPFRSGERIAFSYLVSNKYVGETAELRVLRAQETGGPKEMVVKVECGLPNRLVPVHIAEKPPSFFIIAGLVFTPVTVPYLRSEYGKDYEWDSPVKLLDAMMHQQPEEEGQQVVVLSQVLVADINIGYEDIQNVKIVRVNGTEVKNLRQFVEIVTTTKDDFLRLDLEYSQVVVLETRAARASTPQILAMHCISEDRSADLK